MDPKILAVRKHMCEQQFIFFCRVMFKSQFMNKMLMNWHIDEIVEVLEAIERGDILNLVINMPPRLGKTQIAVIFFVAWCIAKNPGAKFIHLSYSDDLALDNSSKIKELILSDEFQSMWPIKLKDDAKSKKKWYTAAGGGLYATAAGGAITGFGAGNTSDGYSEDVDQEHWKELAKQHDLDVEEFLVEPPENSDLFWGGIIIDDPLKVDDGSSNSRRNATNERLPGTIMSRRNSTKTPIIIIMQRIHEDDMTGYVLGGPGKEPQVGGEWHHLCLKAINTDENGNEESIWEFKLPLKQLKEMEKFQRHILASQYQQTPQPQEGDMIKLKHFGRYEVPPVEFEQILFSMDTAYTANQINDPSVCEVFGKYGNRWYLLHVWRDHVTYPELLRTTINLAKRFNPHGILVENKASGQSLVDDLRKKGLPAIPMQPEADKVTRMNSQSSKIEAGLVVLPEVAEWLFVFEQECINFPKVKHDDQVDSLSQFLKYVHASYDRLLAVTGEDYDRAMAEEGIEEDEYYDIEEYLEDEY